MFDFDKAFHKQMTSITENCPCKKCDEYKYHMNNPYYQSIKCDGCKTYKDWKNTID